MFVTYVKTHVYTYKETLSTHLHLNPPRCHMHIKIESTDEGSTEGFLEVIKYKEGHTLS